MIEIKWKGHRVGLIEDGKLTEATEAFEGIWKEFKKKGVGRLGPAGTPEQRRKWEAEGVLADGVYVTYELSPFLVDLELGGYEITRTGKDTHEARLKTFRKERRKQLHWGASRRVRRKLADVLAKGAERLRRSDKPSDLKRLDGPCELCGKNDAMGAIRLKPGAAKRYGQCYIRICGKCMEDMLDKAKAPPTVH